MVWLAAVTAVDAPATLAVIEAGAGTLAVSMGRSAIPASAVPCALTVIGPETWPVISPVQGEHVVTVAEWDAIDGIVVMPSACARPAKKMIPRIVPVMATSSRMTTPEVRGVFGCILFS
ncbi:MAG: hypothetical protein NVS2B16_23830 [Chloroflexota bacterium]